MTLSDLMVEAMTAEDARSADAGEQHVPIGDASTDEHTWRYPTLQRWVHEWLVPTLERDRNNESPRVSWRLSYLEPAPVGTGS